MYSEAITQHLASMCEGPADIKVVSTDEIADGAILAAFIFDGEARGIQSAVYYPATDMLFTPTDWQGRRPKAIDEISDYQWMDSAGDEAIVMNDLPTAFAAVRDEYRKAFGIKVRAAREEMGLSQNDLSKRSGLQQAAVSRIESGRYSVTLDTITRLSAVLGDLI